jgi:hypothetical protein
MKIIELIREFVFGIVPVHEGIYTTYQTSLSWRMLGVWILILAVIFLLPWHRGPKSGQH